MIYTRDPELCLQFYREDIADDAFYASPSPIEVLAEVVHGLITRMSRRLAMWLRPSRGDGVQLAPR